MRATARDAECEHAARSTDEDPRCPARVRVFGANLSGARRGDARSARHRIVHRGVDGRLGRGSGSRVRAGPAPESRTAAPRPSGRRPLCSALASNAATRRTPCDPAAGRQAGTTALSAASPATRSRRRRARDAPLHLPRRRRDSRAVRTPSPPSPARHGAPVASPRRADEAGAHVSTARAPSGERSRDASRREARLDAHRSTRARHRAPRQRGHRGGIRRAARP